MSASTGTETARYEYGPFGEPLRMTGPVAGSNPFRFSTKRTEDGTGLVLYEYRAYSPTSGRWLSRDVIGESGGVSLYGFVGNEPSQLVDKDGRAAVIVIGGISVTVAECALAAVTTCLVIPACRDALIDLVRAGVREIGKCIDKCRPKRVRCKPCVPPAGTTMYRIDFVPPSRPHWPYTGTHTHHYVVMQSPVTAPVPCFCWPHKTGVTDGISPYPGEIPYVEPGGGGVEYY
ncbi:RHS repeat-associated core domain-containing protein [Limisphaera ngatamarikiensis]